MTDCRPDHRGAPTNPDGRFERRQRFAVDDGWWQDDDLPPLRTTVGSDSARTIITRNDSPDIPFEQSINPYRGCEHGCIYCYARPSHAYLGLSAGLDFETRLYAKPNAASLLEAELRRPGYRCRTIAIGTNTDAYQPIERSRKIMRGIIEVLAAFRHPVTITTKSALIVRDIDLLAPMATLDLVGVAVSLTTLDREMAAILEPRAAVPAKRLEAIRHLSEAGIPTMVNVAPVIPALTDHEMEDILAAAADHGVAAASWILLRLPHEVKDLFDQWLARHVPDRRRHVLSLMRQSRQGKLNDPRFGHRFSGTGAYADLLETRFRLACRRLGLDRQPHRSLRDDLFTPPARPGDQLTLSL
ncbi:PA0069 family radical SAM protein [Telmatospirillum sp.]|uniref:PA0069 family radical SAM protein n=1 Tax=Telmatospirillum sp. TaxID=2079197 RepID=UPI00283B3E03|nr:PA0069 family radical SAM protein [Telmatospirillum sp.]MDR3435970.1 PA0069 family radical SAM protein [Telmatospirillum sp.]